MDFDRQLIFFFSALGAFNGFLLSFYILAKTKRNQKANLFLALLVLSLSIRITKSVFFYFNPHLSGLFLQLGLTACSLIGPFLYLYIRTQVNKSIRFWYLHILPFLAILISLSFIFPYWENTKVWRWYVVYPMYFQWFVYVVMSYILYVPAIKQTYLSKKGIEGKEVWNISLIIGVSIIMFAYASSRYTSYIVGALSFSFILYLIILLIIFRKSKSVLNTEKYAKNKIDEDTLSKISKNFSIIKEKELYANPEIKISDVSYELGVSSHLLSQYINNHLGKSFSQLINEYRVEHAKSLLTSNNAFTIEAIGYDSGFNSKSTFFKSFKKLTGTTPSNYLANKK